MCEREEMVKEDECFISKCKGEEKIERLKCKRGNKDNSTRGLKGVRFDKNNNFFIAEINIKGEIKHLGNFNDKYEAYKAFSNAAIDHSYKYGHAPNSLNDAKRMKKIKKEREKRERMGVRYINYS
jgi:hypothetical protein